MTEEQFDAAVERMGDALERTVEGAADQLDRSLTRACRHRPVRFVCKSVSLLTGVGLAAGAFHLAGRGSRTAARVCLISGGLVIGAGILEWALFRKK